MSSPDSGGPTARSCDYIRDRTSDVLEQARAVFLAILLGASALALAGLLLELLLEPIPAVYVESRS